MVSNWAWTSAILTSGGSVDEALEALHQVGHVLRRWRDEGCVAGARAADPVLRPAQFAGLLSGAAHPVEQQPMCLAQQANADRQALRVAKLPLHPAEGADVVRHLLDVVGVGDLQAGFLIEQVRQRGLRALDLRREQGLLADRAVEQPLDGRHETGHPGQARQCQFGRPVQVEEGGFRQGRFSRGQRPRHEGADRLAQGRGGGPGAGGPRHKGVL